MEKIEKISNLDAVLTYFEVFLKYFWSSLEVVLMKSLSSFEVSLKKSKAVF